MECLGGQSSQRAVVPFVKGNEASLVKECLMMMPPRSRRAVADGNANSGGNSRFYVDKVSGVVEDDRFFEEMATLSNRQTLLFQRSCQQLRDLYCHQRDQPQEENPPVNFAVRHHLNSSSNTFPYRLSAKKVSRSDGSNTLNRIASPSRATIRQLATGGDGGGGGKSNTFDRYNRPPPLRLPSRHLSSSSNALDRRLSPPPPPKPPRPRPLPPSPSPSPPSASPLATEATEAEDLYAECLYCVLHQIGCDADRAGQWALVEHLRKAFRSVLDLIG